MKRELAYRLGLSLLVTSWIWLLPFSVQGQSSTYKHPNGQDCVQPTDGENSSTKFHKHYFKNICGRIFKLELILPGGGGGSTGIGAGSMAAPSISHLICEKSKCQGAKWKVH